MNSDIELIERKLKDELCKIYEDDINPLLILNDFENIKNELNKINKELNSLYIKKKLSINYLHRQMQNYNFLLNLENNLNISSKEFNSYHNSEIILNNFFYDNIKKFLMNINYDEIKELIFLGNYQKNIEKDISTNGKLSNIYNETKNSKNISLDSNFSKNNADNCESKENVKILGNENSTDENKNKINHENENDNNNNLFIPIDQSTFQSVPILIRRRAKLDDVNLIYKTLYDMAIKKGSCHPVEKSELTQMNLQVFGQTGEAKIATLRYLKIIEVINKTGSVRLLNCAGIKKKKKKKKTWLLK
ncbi:conserved Plasmodium protein, unknown function [Plasmodium relictum]|uniref:Protein FAM33A n=1 Tax=Plasmodium relictum TaxID=85471 RepID=A0A1J1H4K2_PLARL|nr:conserved Plasmodium protein, unknown function [Plasmodium relictum]CRG99852.1 conserved Plasmodium protein, unknown function [Plasmodium relictum]